MVRAMNHPDYEYTPHSGERVERMRVAQRSRLGIPDGYARIYGVHVPNEFAGQLRPLAADVARREGFDAAHTFVEKAAANRWQAEPVKVAATGWTPERRKRASEAAKARWEAKRAEERAASERQENSAENRVRVELSRLRVENDRIAKIWNANKRRIDALAEAEKALAAVKEKLKGLGII